MSDAINPDHYKRLPAEAIEIIESAIDRAPSNRDALLHGQALKYLLRCWNKNGIEDLKKAKWYLNRLIDSFDASEAEQLATGEVTGEVKPPDGWRWLEMGEKFFLCDTTVDKDGNPYLKSKISKQYCERHTCQMSKTFIRRNRFEVGEKVMHINGIHACVVVECDHEKDQYVIVYNGRKYVYESKCLVPYIEDAK